MIGKKAEQVINRAVRLAMDHDHEYFTLEHVTWCLLDEREISETLRACNTNPTELKSELFSYMEREVPRRGKTGAPAENSLEAPRTEPPMATVSIQRLIQRAILQVQASGKTEVEPIDFFISVFQEREAYSLYLLSKHGVDRLDVINYVSHGIRKDGDGPSFSEIFSNENENSLGPPGELGGPGNGGGQGTEKQDPLALYTQNLNARAKAGKIDPLVGRVNELERMVQTLCRRRKNNPLLVGEAGVGKTALAEGLALKIVDSKVPEPIQNCEVYSLDLGAVLAGAKFRGDFEQRLKQVLSALQKRKERGFEPILFIDEIHTLIGAGSVSGGVMDAANLLKPLLTQGELRCIGSTTYSEFRNVFEKDHALARRFQKIDVIEPTADEATQILNGVKPKLEEHHAITYTPEAIRGAVDLSVKYLTDRFLPDKAIDLLDECGAKARLSGAKLVDLAAIEEMVSQIARIPARSVSTSQKSRLKNLDRDLKITIFGQDPAIDAVVAAIRMARSGLRSGDKPVGNFLFCGPTGVGKTELSKQLAHAMGVPFLRFDMSEYGEKHTVSRLIGAPPGYVGFEQAGLLTDAVLKNPHAVVLLDEIEKAHSDIWNILLQVMDHGTLTDNNGRKIDFRNVILLLTSNVGARDIEKRPLGMNASAQMGTAQKAVEQTFSPEFRNRLDAIVYFNPLDQRTIQQVVDKHLLELESQLLGKQVEISFENEVKQYLAEKGYDRLMGARPMGRLIQESIKRPLSEQILFGELENGGSVRVFLSDGKLEFEIKKRVAPSGNGMGQLQSLALQES